MQEHHAGPFHITLAIRPDPQADEYRVRGQGLADGDQPIAGEAHLSTDSGLTATAEVDSFGEFSLGTVNPGSYRLTLGIPGARVEIEELEIGGDFEDRPSPLRDQSTLQ